MKSPEKGSGSNAPETPPLYGHALPVYVHNPDALNHVDGANLAVRSGDPMAIRAIWMRMQGLSEDEISEMCDPGVYPGNVADELENLRAAEELRQSPLTSVDLERMAQEHRPPADWK